ncbi:MAG TPA: sulfurtransferase [Chloroflexota bacterium]
MRTRHWRRMDRRQFLALAGGVLAGAALGACAPTPAAPAPAASGSAGYANPDLLAETPWLAERLQDVKVRVVDLRTEEKYRAGHIPNAVWVDGAKLKDPDDKLYVIAPERFSKWMGELGIGPETTVVAYDDQGGLWAARLWWVLDYYGHANAKVLNGGWNKWIREGRPTSTEVPTFAATEFPIKINPDVVCSLDQVKEAIGKEGTIIVDARSPGEYNGTDVRAKRGGHIPQAINIEWTRNLTEQEPRVFKSADELRQLYESAGVTKDKEIIVHCQTAVRSAHTFFALRLIGYGRVRNYDGSWAEWGNREDTPIER